MSSPGGVRRDSPEMSREWVMRRSGYEVAGWAPCRPELAEKCGSPALVAPAAGSEDHATITGDPGVT